VIREKGQAGQDAINNGWLLGGRDNFSGMEVRIGEINFRVVSFLWAGGFTIELV